MRPLLALVLLACAGCAANNVGGGLPLAVSDGGGRAAQQAESAAPAAVTLTWTMPTRKANGDTLGTAPLDWEAAYSRQSPTYLAHEFWIRNYPDTATRYWPTVRAECEPLVVASGTATPGAIVAWPALDVPAGWWPFSWVIRTRQRPNGAWSLWSNFVTRANND